MFPAISRLFGNIRRLIFVCWQENWFSISTIWKQIFWGKNELRERKSETFHFISHSLQITFNWFYYYECINYDLFAFVFSLFGEKILNVEGLWADNNLINSIVSWYSWGLVTCWVQKMDWDCFCMINELNFLSKNYTLGKEFNFLKIFQFFNFQKKNYDLK
jgi:hypothetical protein